jgi:hypothetical protein
MAYLPFESPVELLFDELLLLDVSGGGMLIGGVTA